MQNQFQEKWNKKENMSINFQKRQQRGGEKEKNGKNKGHKIKGVELHLNTFFKLQQYDIYKEEITVAYKYVKNSQAYLSLGKSKLKSQRNISCPPNWQRLKF